LYFALAEGRTQLSASVRKEGREEDARRVVTGADSSQDRRRRARSEPDSSGTVFNRVSSQRGAAEARPLVRGREACVSELKFDSASKSAGGTDREGKARGAAAAVRSAATIVSSFTCAAGVGHTAGVNAARAAATDDDTASAEEERRSSEFEFEFESLSACAGGVRMSGEGEGGWEG
jgi:hypothetical protein